MSTISPLILVLFLVLSPALIIYLCLRLTVLDKLGSVLIAFSSGIALSAALPSLFQLEGAVISGLQSQVSEFAIALAIPLLLLSSQIRQAFKLARQTLKAFALALCSVVFMSFTLALLFASELDDFWQMAGMAVGAYTGGGPNMAAIKAATQANEQSFITMTTYDILLSSLYLLFILSAAKPLFSRLLPLFTEHENTADAHSQFVHMADQSARGYLSLLDKSGLAQATQGLLVALVCIASARAVAQLFEGPTQATATIVGITSFGLLAACSGYINRLKSSFQLGMYCILVFCFCMGTMVDLAQLSSLNVPLFAYIGLMLIGSLAIHACLCYWLKIDADTFIISSSAAIMSVPFIPVVAASLRNNALIVPGFAVAIIGYALGNYLGIAVAFGLKYIL